MVLENKYSFTIRPLTISEWLGLVLVYGLAGVWLRHCNVFSYLLVGFLLL